MADHYQYTTDIITKNMTMYAMCGWFQQIYSHKLATTHNKECPVNTKRISITFRPHVTHTSDCLLRDT